MAMFNNHEHLALHEQGLRGVNYIHYRRVCIFGLPIAGLGLKVEGVGLRLEGSGLRVAGLGLKVQQKMAASIATDLK